MGYTKLESVSVTPPQSADKTSTPTPLLTRQQSSITAEDFGFYDSIPKEPTPLLGSWADVWSSRQASEIILEDIDKEKESQSMQLVEEPEDEEIVCATSDLDEMTPSASTVSTAATAAAPLEEVLVSEPTQVAEPVYYDYYNYNQYAAPQYQYPVDPSMEEHARHVYYYNPYGQTTARNDLHVCQCEACIAQNRAHHAQIEEQRANAFNPQVSAPVTPKIEAVPAQAPLPIKLSSPAVPPTTGGFQTHSAVPPPPPHAPREELQAAGMSTINDNANVMPRQLSLFMPPPPPSLMTPEILERDGTKNVASFIRYAMDRWYKKTTDVQKYFVAEEDCCPNPETMDFATWSQACTDWWFRNFEFAQMKPSSYAAMQGYAAPYGGGYPAPASYEPAGQVW